MPDPRLDALDCVVQADRIVPATIDFVDIAGLVRGASKGEGLGNQFLAHIREVDAVVQVARCFEDANVVHVENRVDPVADIETVTTELCLKDLDTVQKRVDRGGRWPRRTTRSRSSRPRCATALARHLDDGKPARTFRLPDHAEAPAIMREMHLLTAKPTFYIANVDEASLANLDGNKHYQALKKRAEAEGRRIVPICAALEAQIAELDPADRPEFLAERRPQGAGAARGRAHRLSSCSASSRIFTAGKHEVRAWTIRKGSKAPQAAGVIHTDFEKGFIKAESSGGRTS